MVSEIDKADPRADRDDHRAAEPETAGSAGGLTRKQVAISAATGIGSAALVAALLYANRGRKKRGA